MIKDKPKAKFATFLAFLSFVMSGYALWKVQTGTPEKEAGGSTCGVNAAFSQQVEAALVEKPDMILKAINSLAQKDKQKEEATQKEAAQKNHKEIFENAADPVGGNPEGDVTLVEFFDYRCGYCRRAYGVVEDVLKHDKNVKFIYKEFPIMGDAAMSKAALAANKQGKYAEFHKALMNSTGDLSPEALKSMAEKLGLDVAKWEKDMAAPEIEKELKDVRDLADKMGLSSTPNFVMTGGKVVPGLVNVDKFREMIDETRKSK